MKNFFRRFFAPAAALVALVAAPSVVAAPPLNVTITAPSAGSLGTLSSPTNSVSLTATATASSGGATITQIDFRVNGTSVGVATTSPFSVQWTPSAPGAYIVTAIATDSTSTPNTLTSASVAVAVPVLHLSSILQPVANSTIPQGSEVMLRGSVAMTDGVVSSVQFILRDSFLSETALGAPVTGSQYFQLQSFPDVTFPTGVYNLIARVTPSGGGSTWESTASFPITIVPQVGLAPVVSLVSPLVSDVIAVGNAVTLTATATDADGFIPNTAPGGVSFYADGELVATDLTAPYSVTWTPALAKTVTLVAVGTDDKGNARSSSRTVTVLSAAPSVSISSPVNNSSGTAGTPVTVSANATAGVGTTIASVQFLADGSPIGSADTTAPYSVSWTPATTGTVALTARVTDSNGTSVTSTLVNVNVSSAPGTLSAVLTSPSNGGTVPLGTTAALTATATAAGSATIARVDFFAGTTGVGTALSSPYSVSWTPTSAGVVALSARVTDSNGATATSPTSNVIVSSPSVSLTAPLAASTIVLGSSATISASASAVGPATISKVEFFSGTTLLSTSFAAPFTFSWTPITAGAVSLTARVTDSSGAAATSSAVAVTVATSVPTVALTAPTNGTTVALGASTSLTATASASGGAVVSRVDFLAGTTIVGTALTSPYSVTWSPSATGISALTARVTDTNGTVATSTAVNVNVTGPTIAISAPTSGAAVVVGTSVGLTATATAVSPATISKVDFFAGTALVGTANSSPYTVSWIPASAGSVSITARVTDSAGAVVTSTAVAVTAVTSVPTVSVTAPSNGANIALGTSATITATASASSGATVNRVDFLAGSSVVGTALVPPYSVLWTPSSSGVIALSARVTDTSGSSVTSTVVNVNVTGPSVTLVSNLPSGGIGTIGSTITLTASPSAVSPATVQRVDFYSGASLLGSVSSSPFNFDWVPTTGGTFSLSARVVDLNTAVVSSSALSVTVAPSSASVALTSPVAGASIAVGSASTLVATASASVGQTVTRVDFLAGGTIVGTSLAAPYSVSWTPATAAVTSLSARVTDSAGVQAASSPVLVTVVGATGGSLGAVLSLSGSTVIPGGSSRGIAVAVSGGTGVYDRVELYYDRTTLVGTDTAAPYNFLFTAPVTVGTHYLSVRVIDSNGIVVTSPEVPITVTQQIGVAPLASIVTPASGSFLGIGTQTIITGTASDADGSITSVQVFANGVSLGNATLAGPTWVINWTPTTTGVVSLSAIASDSSGNAVAAPSVGVTVTDSASPSIFVSLSPGAVANGIATLPSGAVRNVLATVSPSTGRAVVRVEFFVDGTKVGEDTSAPYTFRYVAPDLAAGEQSHAYVLSARATDNAGAARDTLQSILVVAPIGQPPVVNLLTPTNNTQVVPNTAVSLASTAVSPGGTITTVQYYVNGNPALVNGGNAITSAPYTTTFFPTAAGSYTIDAIATDDRGNSRVSNSATLTAAFATPTIVFTSPNPNATARATPNVPITLAAQATVQTGTGAAVLLVEFLLDGVQIGADTTAPYSFSWIPTAAQLGTHVLIARVTDTYSQTALSAPVTVNVANVIGSPPTVSVSASPIPGGFGLQTVSTVNFVANAVATGAGSTLNNVEIFLNDISIGLAAREQTTNLYRVAYDLSRFDFTAVTPIINDITGAVTYPVRLYAIARDSNNNQTVSSTTNLTINPATSAPPSIQLVAATPTNITAGTQFFMQANMNDNDGVVTTIQLYANGSLVATIGNPQQGQFLTYTANNAGRFNLYAVVTDDTGNTAVSSPSIVVNVTAVSAPTTTITRPTDNATTATVGSPVFLEGTAVNTATTQIPTMQFVATAGGGNRQVINGTRVGNTTTYRAIWTPVNPDTYTITTQASVGVVQGTSSTSRRVVATEVIGLPPAISLTRSPGVLGVPTTATTAATADFCATASDPDGSVVQVEFFLDRNSVGLARKDPDGNTWRLSASFAGLLPGATEVVALAKDSSGNIVASSTSNISVTAASSIAPSITVTPSTLNPAFNRAVTLRANARDSDGTVTNVQYFANATSIATSTNSGSLFLTTWTPTLSGTYYLWALATDNSGNTRVSDTVEINVRRNNPVLEDSAFILQTYQDIANTTTINPLVFDQLDEQLGAGTLSRADIIVSPLTANGGVAMTDLSGFQAPVNFLATYYVLMGYWPTPQNYTNFVATARFSLSGAVTNILNANEYFAKYGVVPTATLLNAPTGALPAQVFLDRLWANSGSKPSTNRETDLVRFMSNNVLSPTIGRGYGPVGLSQAIAEFVTNTNSTNTALFAKARAAALFYQLARPPVTMTVDEITARIDALLKLPTQAAIADAVMKDVLYGYRFLTITKHPQSLVVSPRSGALFRVEAQGAPPLVYQWLLNGAPIAGATNPLLSLTNVDVTRVGTYTVAITSATATATSDRATLTLTNTPTRLANISTRGVTSAGANVLIGGFVVSGNNANQTRQMLIRVVGPTLAAAPFNVTGALQNPRLEVYANNNPNPVLVNDDWGNQTGGGAQVTAIQQASARVGAFALPANSGDAAALAVLPPGLYTVQAAGPLNNPAASGVVLIEAYDVTQGGGAGPKASNVSTRGNVGTGSNILIAGFVVNGEASRRMLIRGAGPALTRLNVPGVLSDPQIKLIDQASGVTLRTNDDWASGDDAGVIASAASAAGAFPFASGSKDSAMIVMLPPGAYTVQLSGVNNATGVGIVEVYDVDP